MSFHRSIKFPFSTNIFVKDLLNDPCVYCYEKSTELDHIFPKSKRGSDYWSNRAPSCKRCGNLKADISLLTFLFIRQKSFSTVRRRCVKNEADFKSRVFNLMRYVITKLRNGKDVGKEE